MRFNQTILCAVLCNFNKCLKCFQSVCLRGGTVVEWLHFDMKLGNSHICQRIMMRERTSLVKSSWICDAYCAILCLDYRYIVSVLKDNKTARS